MSDSFRELLLPKSGLRMTARNMGSSWLTIALLLLLGSFPALKLSGQIRAKQLDSHARALTDPAHYREALVHLRRATALNTTNAEAWNQLGVALQNTGSDAGAVEAYGRAVKVDPAHLDARNNYGFMLVNTGHAEEGVKQFEQILRADPANTMARINIGFAHL